MSSQRKQKQQQIKKQIGEILRSVKQQKQHIENQLAKNDMKIKHYCEQYQRLRHETDYEHLTKNETLILKSIISGLEEASVNPLQILGKQVDELMENKHEDGGAVLQQLSSQEVVQIQESIIKNLWQEIRKAEEAQDIKQVDKIRR